MRTFFDYGVGLRRRALVLGCVATVVVGLAACGSSSNTGSGSATSGSAAAGEGKKVNIAFFGLAAVNVYTMTMFNAAKAEAAKHNATVQFFDGKFDGGVQARQVQDAITSGRFDAMIVLANDGVGIAPAVKQAIDKGIKVAALQFQIGPDPTNPKPQVAGLTTSVIEDVRLAAQSFAEGINKACHDRDPCKAAMLWGSRKNPLEAERQKVLEADLDKNVQLVNQSDTDFLRAKARTVTTDVLEAHPDINVIASTGDQMTYGAEEAIEKAGKSVGAGPNDITLLGFGATTEGVEKIKQGKWLESYVLLPQTMTVKATDILLKAVRGQALTSADRYVEQSSLSPIGPLATKESLQGSDFNGEYKAL